VGDAAADYTVFESSGSSTTARPHAPRIWAVASHRAGENSQIFGLAERLKERLGARVEIHWLRFNALGGPLGLLQRVGPIGLGSESRAALTAPWPDVVVSAGVTNEPVCRWIRDRSRDSRKGATRLVFLGRTWAPRHVFDLVVTTPQYRLPNEPNVVHNLMTQHGVTQARLAAEGARWRTVLDSPDTRRVGVLVGGDSGPHVFGVNSARRLAQEVNALCRQSGAVALVSSSARTRQEALDVLQRTLDPSTFVYRWRPNDPDNPYFGILALADELVVTSDSIAMLSEAAATRKPVHVFDLAKPGVPHDRTLESRAYGAMMAVLPQRLSRDIGLFHAAYFAGGFGVPLGERAASSGPGAEREIDATMARVAALLPR